MDRVVRRRIISIPNRAGASARHGDAWADWPSNISTSLRADWDAIYGLLLHEDYLGLTPQEIGSATSSTDGLTDYFTIAQPQDALETLLTAVLNALG